MFWSLELPVAITFVLMVALVLVIKLAAPKLGERRHWALLGGMVLSIALFVPSCTAVMYVVDRFRFGIFHYATVDEINDFKISSAIPNTATELTVHQAAGGFRARFKVAKPALDQWFAEGWSKVANNSDVQNEFETAYESNVDVSEFDSHFEGLGWDAPAVAYKYEGPVYSNGAGFWLWYDAKRGVGYVRRGYW
jgi:hypothetical protein